MVVVAAVSCGGKSSPPQQGAVSARWSAPSILAPVPAESPYVIALLDPVSDALRRRLMQQLDERFTEILGKLEALRGLDRGELEPWKRALFAFIDELHGKPLSGWLEQLGFDPRGRFALYGLSMWPVMRLEIASPTRLRAAIERILSAAGIQPQQRTLDGKSYWLAGGTDFSFIAAVLDREAVAALVPTATLDAALPLVLGTRPPEHSLAASTVVPEALAHHGFMGFLFAYVDMHNIIEIIAGPKPSALDIPIRAATGQVTPVCRGELDRLARVMPRLVFGYRRFDDAGFEGSIVFELPPAVLGALRKLRATVPEVTARVSGRPLLAFGVAADPAEAAAWLRDTARGVRDRPFACPWFTGINKASAELGSTLDRPLPPTWRGLHGVAVTLDEASLTPPNLVGHVLVSGDRVADLVTSLAGAVPAVAGIPLSREGKPVALPVQQLRLPVRSAHFALTTDRLVIAAGEGSERRAAQHLASPVPSHSPLLMMAFDTPRLQQLMIALGQKPFENFSTLAEGGLSIDIAEHGLGLDVWGTWRPAAPATPPPAAPPAKP